jgi:hypothetical protein
MESREKRFKIRDVGTETVKDGEMRVEMSGNLCLYA